MGNDRYLGAHASKRRNLAVVLIGCVLTIIWWNVSMVEANSIQANNSGEKTVAADPMDDLGEVSLA